MRKISIMCALILMLGLCACSERIDGPEQSGASSGSSSNVAEAQPLSSSSPRLEADLGNNMKVAAEVQIPDSGKLSVWQAQAHTFDANAICGLLFEGNYWADNSLPPANGVTYYSDGKFLFVHIMDNGRESINFFPAQIKASITEITDDIQSSPSELSFMTSQDAAQMVQELLKKMGLDTKPISCYALDKETITATAKAMQSKYGADSSAYISHPECYVIRLTQTLGGTDIYYGDNIVLKDGTELTPGVFGAQTYIQAVITEKGLEELTISNCFDPGALEQENPQLITAQQAIDVIQKCYENIINTQKLTINNLTLVYAVLPKSLKDTVSLEFWPIWVCQTVQETGGNTGRGGERQESGPNEKAIFVDAVHGQILKERFQ